MNTFLTQSVSLADAGLVIGQRVIVNLNTIAEEVAATLIPDHIQFKHSNLPFVHCDREKITQVFQNLILNALEHGKPKEIRISVEEDQEYLCLLFSNDGFQIPAEHRARIFDQGFTTKDGGGLGLTITQRIINAHDWSISLDSTEKLVGV